MLNTCIVLYFFYRFASHCIRRRGLLGTQEHSLSKPSYHDTLEAGYEIAPPIELNHGYKKPKLYLSQGFIKNKFYKLKNKLAIKPFPFMFSIPNTNRKRVRQVVLRLQQKK